MKHRYAVRLQVTAVSIAVVIAASAAGAAIVRSGQGNLGHRHGASTQSKPLLRRHTDGDIVSNWATVASANQLNGSLPAMFPDSFAGITLSNDNSTITIYETTADGNLESYAASQAPSGALRYVIVANSWRSLQAVFNRLGNSIAALSEQGIDVAGYYTDAPSNRVVVQVANLTASQTEQLQSQFGPSLISVVTAQPLRTHDPVDGAVFG